MIFKNGEPAVSLEDFGITIRSNVELAKEHGFVPEIDRFRDALEAVLLFHSGGEWTLEKATAWRSRMKGDAATGRALCDHIRSLLGGGT